jgi:hypothetical protein
MHKGYKCLDVSTGRVYISRDVVFDKGVFPFSKLHPNAGAQLKSKITLLHPTLLHPNDGDKLVYGHVSNAPLTAGEFAEIPRENAEEIEVENTLVHQYIHAHEELHEPTTSSLRMM